MHNYYVHECTHELSSYMTHGHVHPNHYDLFVQTPTLMVINTADNLPIKNWLLCYFKNKIIICTYAYTCTCAHALIMPAK